MANQNGSSASGRDFGDYDYPNGGRGRQARDQREDDGAREDDDTRSYDRYDHRDVYRYGGGGDRGRTLGQGASDFGGAERHRGPYGGPEAGPSRGGFRNYGDRGRGGRGPGGDYPYGGYGEFGAYGQSREIEGQGRRGPEPYGQSGYGRAAASGYGPDSRFEVDPRRGQEQRSFWERTSDEVSSWFGDDEAARRRRQDEVHAGQHRGRGPSDYVRSDERIREDVNDRLTDDPHIDATSVNVQVKSGEVTLSGTVKSRNDKRHAEDLSESCSGVKHVQNNLRIHDSNYDAQLSQSGSAAAGSAASSAAATSASRTN